MFLQQAAMPLENKQNGCTLLCEGSADRCSFCAVDHQKKWDCTQQHLNHLNFDDMIMLSEAPVIFLVWHDAHS